MVHTIADVVERSMCIGCGACDVATNGAVPVTLGPRGLYTADLSSASRSMLQLASQVCPFSDDASDEDQIANSLFGSLPRDPDLGRIRRVLVGRQRSQEQLVASSSGGLTSWLVVRLLELGKVDGVIHVGSTAAPPGQELFAYRVSHEPHEAERHRKSIYFATSLESALAQIRNDGRRYAVVGVPCYIKAVRLLTQVDSTLDEQIRFCIGIICGHLKSQFFAEALAWQLGVPPSELKSVDFRVKDPNHLANRYSFEATSAVSGQPPVRATAASMFGGDWGMGLFQPEACNFCDDIFAETADVVLGDAWLPEFNADWRGTNVLVTRNADLDRIFEEGQAKGTIELATLDARRASESQAANFRHRRLGLGVRLADDFERGFSIPRKRVQPNARAVGRRRRRLVRARRALSAASFEAYVLAKTAGDYRVFERELGPLVRRYRRTTMTPVRRALSSGKAAARRVLPTR